MMTRWKLLKRLSIAARLFILGIGRFDCVSKTNASRWSCHRIIYACIRRHSAFITLSHCIHRSGWLKIQRHEKHKKEQSNGSRLNSNRFHFPSDPLKEIDFILWIRFRFLVSFPSFDSVASVTLDRGTLNRCFFFFVFLIIPLLDALVVTMFISTSFHYICIQ